MPPGLRISDGWAEPRSVCSVSCACIPVPCSSMPGATAGGLLGGFKGKGGNGTFWKAEFVGMLTVVALHHSVTALLKISGMGM